MVQGGASQAATVDQEQTGRLMAASNEPAATEATTPCVDCQSGQNPVQGRLQASNWTHQDIQLALTVAIVTVSLITLYLEMQDRSVVS
jgi:hypothetical protein